MNLRAVFCLLVLSLCRGQVPPPALQSGTQEVLLDLIVRDKKGRQVSDLDRSDLEIYDNGARREITSFRLIEDSEVRLVTLIYDRLDPNSRSLARKASWDFLRNEFPPNVVMSVLVLDDGVRAIQAFTNDREALRKAVEHATSGTSREFMADSKRIEAELNAPASDPAGAAMAQITLNILQNSRGPRTAIPGLTAIVNEQYRLPGRKSLLLFFAGI